MIDKSSAGQAFEFRVWTELVQQSQGRLHVFLPLLDSGLDAIVHRLDDGTYIPLQLKSRSELARGQLHFVVLEETLIDDDALLIAGLLAPEGIGPLLLVIAVGAFKQLAERETSEGKSLLGATFSMHPVRKSHWAAHLVPSDRLAERLLATKPDPTVLRPAVPPEERHSDWLGFLGEAEVVRRLAEQPLLDLFRPFPDLEMVELVARNSRTRAITGLQVKTASLPAGRPDTHVDIRLATLVPRATTWLAILVWLPGDRRFHETAWLIPSERVADAGRQGGRGRLEIELYPNSANPQKTDPFRIPLAELGERVARGLAASAGRW